MYLRKTRAKFWLLLKPTAWAICVTDSGLQRINCLAASIRRRLNTIIGESPVICFTSAVKRVRASPHWLAIDDKVHGSSHRTRSRSRKAATRACSACTMELAGAEPLNSSAQSFASLLRDPQRPHRSELVSALNDWRCRIDSSGLRMARSRSRGRSDSRKLDGG